MRVGVAGDLRIEAEACNAEVAQAVRQRDVDGAGLATDGELAGSMEVPGDAEHAGEVVSGAEGDQRQRAANEVELPDGKIQRPVATADDDAIVGASGTFCHLLR